MFLFAFDEASGGKVVVLIDDGALVFSFVVLELPFVDGSIFPPVDSEPVFLVVLVVASIVVALELCD